MSTQQLEILQLRGDSAATEHASLLDLIVSENRVRQTDAQTHSATKYRINLKDRSAPATLVRNKRCGSDWNGFHYDLSIEASGLDSDGFVVDNRAFDKLTWADRLYVASCEMLAGGLIQAVHAIVGDRLLAVKASVRNNTGNVEVEWSQGDELPPDPRVATVEEAAADDFVQHSGVYPGSVYSWISEPRSFYDPPRFFDELRFYAAPRLDGYSLIGRTVPVAGVLNWKRREDGSC